ncbi:uncharacterized protein EI90DRAFT_3288243 [Cantharellus anzutake]|uniref:uncharacterized protein n=1 Tax=Cantharellus anzutake TaxID=1750568 RepID=UPI0019047319|nr:uncharacterized protein EI90DRAFT_3288243 [Cantharellus anzutake]KAF8333938.1 hypothetical protein EI90DRAFT_3288243 [Cantharellus anzutake]
MTVSLAFLPFNDVQNDENPNALCERPNDTAKKLDKQKYYRKGRNLNAYQECFSIVKEVAGTAARGQRTSCHPTRTSNTDKKDTEPRFKEAQEGDDGTQRNEAPTQANKGAHLAAQPCGPTSDPNAWIGSPHRTAAFQIWQPVSQWPTRSPDALSRIFPNRLLSIHRTRTTTIQTLLSSFLIFTYHAQDQPRPRELDLQLFGSGAHLTLEEKLFLRGWKQIVQGCSPVRVHARLHKINQFHTRLGSPAGRFLE